VRAFTRTKLVFDFDPRAYAPRDVLADVRAAGWTRIDVRPFLLPQRATLPRPLTAALLALEPTRAGRMLTRVRFPLVVSASE
jgi:hypothetical protein